ncbi:winged helix-turn-helix domain-containing protein, partial [Methylobacterium sp. WL7]|uniref:winged helix-turn-helix domain-containing protein n=1 Tax=Methylobacterium sp. WL7 TaxID=2603900 RepID=UPI001650439F
MNAPFHHHAVIAALREENDILRETVRQLREDLAPRMAFPKAWKLSPRQSAVLSCIMAASPHVATRGRILSALYGDREAPDCADKLLNVMVYEIRKRLR